MNWVSTSSSSHRQLWQRLGLSTTAVSEQIPPPESMVVYWLPINVSLEDFLRQNDHPSLIRFISDDHRDEPPQNLYLNISAGENLLRYLRGRHYNPPVLIYTGNSTSATQYIRSHHLTGSTVHRHICLRFISALAVGRTDDFSWMSFMAA
jgi:hypothetical protein